MSEMHGCSRVDRFIDVVKENGEAKTVRVVEGQLLVCKGCCCGNTERGHAAVPLDRFKREWKERGIRLRIHLTISGCLGPCTVSNVVMLIYKSSTVWFHSINSENDVVQIYDYLERLLDSGQFDLPTNSLAEKVFQRYTTDAVCAFQGSPSCQL